MDRDLVSVDDSNPGWEPQVESTNWVGHVAHVPPPRKGPRPSWTPAPSGRRDESVPPAAANPATARMSGGGATPRVAIPIAPPMSAPAIEGGPVPSLSSFRTPAPAVDREGLYVDEPAAGVAPEPQNRTSTMLLLGAGLGAVTAAAIGSVGVIAVVVAVVAFVPRGAAAPPAPSAPVVVTAVAPGEPSRAIVSRDVGGRPVDGAPRAAAVSTDGRAPAPQAEGRGWVESTVQAVSALVAPAAPAPVARSVPRPPPRVEPGPAAAPSGVTGADFGMAPSDPRTAGARPGDARSAVSPTGEVSVADQVVVDRPGASMSAPVGRPVDEIVVPMAAPAAPASAWSTVVDTVASYVSGAPAPVAGGPAVAPSAPVTGLPPSDDLDDLISGLGAERAAPSTGWDDPASAPVGRVAAGGAAPAGSGAPVGSAPAGSAQVGSAPAGSAQAADADPTAQLLADLELDRPAPTAQGWGAAPVAPAVAPAPTASSGGWMDTVVAVGSTVASYVTGGPVGGDPTFAAGAPAPAASQGLALDDDGQFNSSGLRGSRPATAAPADDGTAAMLADLDDPLPGAGQPRYQGGAERQAAAPAAAAAPTGAGADLDTAALLASLDEERAPMASELRGPTMAEATVAGPMVAGSTVAGSTVNGTEPAPAAAAAPAPAPTEVAAAPAPASGGWFDTVATVGSTVAALVSGEDATFATPTSAAPAAGPGLALDDDETVRARQPGAWETSAASDDPTAAVLAELDGPMPGAGRPTASAAPRSASPASAASDDGSATAEPDTASLIAGLGDDRAAVAPAAAAPAGSSGSTGYLDTAASWAGAVASTLLGESAAPTAPAAAPPPAWAAEAAVFDAPTAAAAPAARPCGEGEHCDGDLATWRDDAGSTNLLEAEDLELGPVQRKSEAELFALPSESDAGGGEFDLLTTLLVNVTTDVAGIPVEIDGKRVGSTPLTAEVAAGWHDVKLFGGGDAFTSFRLNADQDPDEWCFELKGRALKNVTCR